MCYRTKLNTALSEIERSFNARFVEPDRYQPQLEINGFAHQATPVIIDEDDSDILMLHWGLIPFWAKDDKIKKATLNAKIETATEKPSYRNAVKNRCLVIADAYYEWQWLDPKGKEKQKYRIKPKDQDVFAFAGIYSNWTNPETNEEIGTYSIITTEANELMSEIHNNKKRMPVVLQEKDRHLWLKQHPLEKFAFPYEVALEATPVYQ